MTEIPGETMFSVDTYCDRSDFPFTDLFEGAGHVWDGLVRLREYMDENGGEFLDHELIADGIPLSAPVVLHEGIIHPARDCKVEFGSVTRGELKITLDGVLLHGASLIMAGVTILGSNIRIGRGVLIESGAWIREPLFIGDHSEVRQGAYLRGYCLVGKRCVIGHATEVKHSIFFNDAKAGHFAYVGDSILGNEVNLGAGTKLANLRFIKGEVQVRFPEGMLNTGLRKLGAVLGDRVQTGCNSVTSPGTLLGPDSILMPNVTAPSGYHPPRSVIR
ncbi:MAG: hypothetical protein Kow0089_10280 [Desulfobulbaceae bacterium]